MGSVAGPVGRVTGQPYGRRRLPPPHDARPWPIEKTPPVGDLLVMGVAAAMVGCLGVLGEPQRRPDPIVGRDVGRLSRPGPAQTSGSSPTAPDGHTSTARGISVEVVESAPSEAAGGISPHTLFDAQCCCLGGQSAVLGGRACASAARGARTAPPSARVQHLHARICRDQGCFPTTQRVRVESARKRSVARPGMEHPKVCVCVSGWNQPPE